MQVVAQPTAGVGLPAVRVWRQRPRSSDNYSHEQECNRGHNSVADDSDIPDLHIRKRHTDQTRKTQDTTDNHENPHRYLQPSTLEYRCSKEH